MWDNIRYWLLKRFGDILDRQPWIQVSQEENAPLGLSRFGFSATAPSDRRGEYAQVNDRS